MFKRWYILFALLCFDNVIYSRNENEITSGKPISQTSCTLGWFSYESMCYKIEYGRLSWAQASERCHLFYSGTMVTIHSQGLADFVTAFFLLSVRNTMWIGLHDRVSEAAYIWDDGSPMDFTNWALGEPSGRTRKMEDCVELPFYNANSGKGMGKWNDGTCDQKLPFICQKERGPFNSEYFDPRLCSPGLGGGWNYLTSCFHFVNESKTWLEAEEHCVKKFEGHLVTIPDLVMELFLNYILGDQEKNMWIGIRMQNESMQQWSSGWQVAYENWALRNGVFIEGTCAARNKIEKWINLPCNIVLPFICEYSTAVPPTLKPNIEGATCPGLSSGWKDLGGDYCYFFETKAHYNWHKTSNLCMKRGGFLVSIHSQDEVNMLHNFIRFKQNAVYIGLYRQNNHIFTWTDGSPLNYVKWDANEPSSSNEKCVEMRTADMKWNDVDCKQLKGYICSIPKVIPNKTHENKGESSPFLILANKTHKNQDESSPCLNGFSTATLVGAIFCVAFVAALIGVIIHYFHFCDRKYERVQKTSGAQFQTASYRKPKDKSELIVIEDD